MKGNEELRVPTKVKRKARWRKREEGWTKERGA